MWGPFWMHGDSYEPLWFSLWAKVVFVSFTTLEFHIWEVNEDAKTGIIWTNDVQVATNRSRSIHYIPSEVTSSNAKTCGQGKYITQGSTSSGTATLLTLLIWLVCHKARCKQIFYKVHRTMLRGWCVKHKR